VFRHASTQNIACVLNDWIHRFQSIPRATGRAGKIDDQRPATHSGDAPAKRCPWKVRQRDHSNALSDSLSFAIYHGASRFGRDVPLRQTRPTRRDHELGVSHIRGVNERPNDLRSFVGARRSRDDFVLPSARPACYDRARRILALPARNRVGHGEHRYAHAMAFAKCGIAC
jgi:hypothetical protein